MAQITAGEPVSAAALYELAEAAQLRREWALETHYRLLQVLVQREWLTVFCCYRCGTLIEGYNGQAYCSGTCEDTQAVEEVLRHQAHLAASSRLPLFERVRAVLSA